jgi:hypothetical protein
VVAPLRGRYPENGDLMTETPELTVINEALAIIDKGLGDMLHRELVSTDEVADLLLDVRMLLATVELPVSELDGAGAAAN